MKELKGEKYIYASLALLLLQNVSSERRGRGEKYLDFVEVGNDSGMKGGYDYQRFFRVVTHKDETFLKETKSSSGFADYSRYWKFMEGNRRPIFYPPTQWEH